MNEDLRNILVGALMLVVLAAVAVFTFGDRRHKSGAGARLIHATFNRVDGLNPGDEVRMSGVKVGEVAGMRLGSSYSAIVDLRIDTPVEIPDDTSAAVHTDSLFGSKHIVLDPGADEKEVAPGGTLTLTQDSVILSELLELIINEGKANAAKLKAATAQPKPAEAPPAKSPAPSDEGEPK